MSSPNTNGCGYAGVPELSRDSKVFLLNYPKIAVSMKRAKTAMQGLNSFIESQVARKPWFDTTRMKTIADWRIIQMWDRQWRSDETPGCPWVHFEAYLNWEGGYVDVSLDIEDDRIVPSSTVKRIAQDLAKNLRDAKYEWMHRGGWLIDENRELNRMLLYSRSYMNPEVFSAEWIAKVALEGLDQLSSVIGCVNETICKTFKCAE